MKTLDIALERMKNQRLAASDLKSAADVVHWMGAVQAQDYPAAKWALGIRMHAATAQGLEEAFSAGVILRTHVMRPTWHFVTPADIRWLLRLTAPRVNAANGHYYRKLELDEAIFKRTNKAITKGLLGKQLTRGELRSVVQSSGVPTDDPLRFNCMLIRAELDGLICSGARQGKQFTYALLDERVPETKDRSREEALADLTLRYFTSHGPATLPDFVWWSGLTVKDANSGLEMVRRQQLVKEEVEGRTYWVSSSTPSVKRTARVAYLLPAFDEYLVSYKDRSAAFDSDDSKEKPRGNTILSPVIVVDGRVIGSWKRSLVGKSVRVTLNYFEPASKAERLLVANAADRYGEFLGMTVVLS